MYYVYQEFAQGNIHAQEKMLKVDASCDCCGNGISSYTMITERNLYDIQTELNKGGMHHMCSSCHASLKSFIEFGSILQTIMQKRDVIEKIIQREEKKDYGW